MPSPESAAPSPFAAVFPGEGEMAARCRAFDWASSALGAPEGWSPVLRAMVRTALESPFPINLWCGAELLLIYNDAYRRVLGAKHPRALGAPGLEVWTEIRADLEPMFAQIAAGGPPVYAEDARFVMARAAGEAEGAEAYFTFGLSAVRDEDGGVVAFLNPAAETTGRVLAERSLAAANRELEVERARLAAVFAQSPSFLAVLRGAGNVFEFVNPAYQQIVGQGRPLIGKPLFEALPETRGQRFDEFLDQVRRTGQPLVFRELPARLERVPGAPPEEHFLDITYLPLVEADGTHDAVIAHGAVVTEQVRARRVTERALAASEAAAAALTEANARLEEQQVELELTNQQLQENAVELETQAEELQTATEDLEERTEEVEQERRRLARVLEQLPVGVVVVDTTGAVVSSNSALDEVLGHPAHRSSAVDEYAAYGGVHADGTPYAPGDYPVARALQRGERVLRELTRYRRGDDRVVTLSISAAPVYDETGAIELAVAAVEDVNDREAARAAAEDANRAKSQFLANMSHELRTPLNAIQGHLQLLEMELHGPLAEQQRQTLARIDRAQRHLLGLINDILGYARLESGRLEYDVQPTVVGDVVREVVPLVEPLLAAKSLTLATRVPAREGGAPLVAWADREKLRQVLLNLLSNAVKFTHAGGAVSVELSERTDAGDASAAGMVSLSVRDTGVGIPADKLEAVFEPFVQVRNPYAPGEGGTGLGLAISRDLARGMGGELRAQSTEGAGSTFTIALRRVEASDDAQGERRSGEERRTLDDRRGTFPDA